MFRNALKLAVFLIILAALNSHQYGQAETAAPAEYRVKAAFLYNFAKFVEWPAQAFTTDQMPLSVCILGKNPFGNEIDIIQGKTVWGRELVIRKISRIEDAGPCHILFISASEKAALPNILGYINRSSMLTVSDMDGFIEAGGMVNLLVLDKKIAFRINRGIAQNVGLKINSQLLKLALEVKN